ncbi:hypothetical protein L7F22_047068 [Adiantum nelumboides]|nr:hypothetical protein [Adiantum nelumboides]
MDKLVVPSLDLPKETKVSKGAASASKAISPTKVEESMIGRGKRTSNVAKKELLQAGNSIRSTIGWTGLVDSLSVYAYIARAQANEAIVEDKRHREGDALGPSKRPTRNSREAQKPPAPEVTMEEAARTQKLGKPRGRSYKLTSDIELGTDLKKVFKERILNSKVKLTLGEVLDIAKRKFHEEVIDIIKRKSQVPGKQEVNQFKIRWWK